MKSNNVFVLNTLLNMFDGEFGQFWINKQEFVIRLITLRSELVICSGRDR